MADVQIIDGADSAAIADWIALLLERRLAQSSGPLEICVPGGSTPFPILENLARSALDWGRIALWPTDDRVVPEDHPASNVGRIRAIMEPAGAEVVSLSVMEEVPHFALSWLGMGADGHIASLFPNSDPRADDREPVRMLTPDPLPPEAPFERVTLTLPSLLDSDAILLSLGASPEKRALLEAALEGEVGLPIARLIAAATQPITCFT